MAAAAAASTLYLLPFISCSSPAPCSTASSSPFLVHLSSSNSFGSAALNFSFPRALKFRREKAPSNRYSPVVHAPSGVKL
ncbi:unnamed protein product [Linum trigynum]|uniref:Secreted protein n=1 Tax=Linum trigynum TaxID=586398 RepID=A0AAV2FRF8_9ROSI